MSSRFLPSHFGSIGLIAGKHRYPLLLAERAREAGVSIRLIAFEGETLPELLDSFPESERQIIKVGQLGKMLDALKRFKTSHAVMAGQITPGRLFKGLHPDLKAIAILARLKERNAETVFGAIADECEKINSPLLDARVFLDDQLAETGNMTGKSKASEEDIAHGIRIAKAVAKENIGQGVVVSRGTVLAVEAFEGTDIMLERAGSFNAKDMIFVKTVNPAQDYRFDVPIFGLKTLDAMHKAKIKTAALEAGNVIILEKEAVLEKAKKLKIAILGY